MYTGHAGQLPADQLHADRRHAVQRRSPAIANDQWKLHAKGLHELTLMLGARIEHLGPWTDRHGNGLATFSPSLYKSAVQRTSPLQPRQLRADRRDYPGITWHGARARCRTRSTSPQSDLLLAARRSGVGHLRPRQHGAAWRLGYLPAPRRSLLLMPRPQRPRRVTRRRTCSQYWNFDGVDEQSPINPSDFNIDVLSPNDT